MKRLLSVAIRSQINKNNHSRLWTIELVFFGTPLQSTHHREQGLRRTVYYQYDLVSSDMVSKTIDSLLSDWSKIVYLYSIVHEFADQFKNGKLVHQLIETPGVNCFLFASTEKYNLQNLVTVKSYNYNNLLLGYGPNKEVTVNIFWCTEAMEFKMVKSLLLCYHSESLSFLFLNFRYLLAVTRL